MVGRKTTVKSFSINTETLEHVRVLAEKETRPASNMIDVLLREAIEARNRKAQKTASTEAE